MGKNRSFDKTQRDWLIEHSLKADNAKYISGETKDHAGLADKLLPEFRAKFPNYRPDGENDEKTLRERIRRWSVTRHTTREQRQATVELTKGILPKISSPRGPRKIIGLDEFQKSDAVSGHLFTVDEGQRRFPVGTHRKVSKQMWDELPDEEKKKYLEKAQARNQQRAEEATGVDETPTLYNRTAIADGCEYFMRSLKEKTGCGSFLCVAGPDRDGKPFVWIRSEGEDRDGISLLDFVLKGISIHADELYALANVWIQRSREDGTVTDGNLAAQLAAALKDARQATGSSPSASAASTLVPTVAKSTQQSNANDTAGDVADMATTNLPVATGTASEHNPVDASIMPVDESTHDEDAMGLHGVFESTQTAPPTRAVVHMEPTPEANHQDASNGVPPESRQTKGKKRKSQGGHAPRQLKRPKGTSGVEMPAKEPTSLAAGRPGREGRKSARQRGLDPLMTLTERSAMETGPLDVDNEGEREEAIQKAGKKRKIVRECCIVFWSKDGQKPFVDVVRSPTTGSGQPIAWNCCVRGGWANVLGVLTWNIRRGGWDKVDGEHPLCREEGHALLRMPDVLVCPGFGEELDRYYRTLRLNQAVTEDTFHELGPPPHMQCVKLAVWDEDGQPPKIHWIYSSDNEPIVLGKIPELTKPMMDAGVDGHYDVWEKSSTGWRRQSMWSATKFEKASWIFIKLVHVGVTPQLGRLLTQSEDEGTFNARMIEAPSTVTTAGSRTSVDKDKIPRKDEHQSPEASTSGSKKAGSATVLAKRPLKRKRPIGDKALRVREEGGKLEQVEGEVKPGGSSKPVIDLTIETDSDCEGGLLEMSDSEAVLSLSEAEM
ncbi:hypothetical protein C8Q70DRAFT_1056972 [Cubamyces menziesii]|nr:hypothetical protein C8Q70DRAFT_1056972 [Cubamyces menziesii]